MRLWDVRISPRGRDVERDRINAELESVGLGVHRVKSTARGFLLEAELEEVQLESLATELLHDSLVESFKIQEIRLKQCPVIGAECYVELKPGVMNPVTLSVLDAASDLNIGISRLQTYRLYDFDSMPDDDAKSAVNRVLANDAIEDVIPGIPRDLRPIGHSYSFRLITIPLSELGDIELLDVSRTGQLALSLDEMKAVQTHYRALNREPTDIELETIAQTWSEHCSHKTLRGRITCDGRTYENLLKETIFAATERVRAELGESDFCVSVFSDNAGVVKFDDKFHVCFKVETHNRPSAIEPYGGANTGLGGVIRDALGTGLGAKPIANTDVFCFARPDFNGEDIPEGVLHPRRVMNGVVAGVRDYGNRTGIPTVNGAVVFDDRYLANPLVYCGTVGLIPVDRVKKEVKPGDLIVAVGGRTGRDGIHGATFSSLSLSGESQEVNGGAVQIGNAITEKKVLDLLIQARDRGLYRAVTDCGAGGFSSAIGEMGAELGAEVHLDQAPLKYEGLSYTEIWISEAQERMVLAVPPERWPELELLCRSEGVEAVALGTFEASGKLILQFQKNKVGELSMQFLHEGRPKVVKTATVRSAPESVTPALHDPGSPTETLKAILASPCVRSKEAIIRQYDHEVQGGSVLKPLVGVNEDGPGDAAVIAPVLGSYCGLAIGCGINPRYGDLDAYAMAANAIDEAVRNLVAVGADPARFALLDNFSWGDVDNPEVLGELVRACEACRDLAIAFRMPFISGKDSLHNVYRSAERNIDIPGTLLISAIGLVPDVRRCVSMDAKMPGNMVYLVGESRNELGGSHYHLVRGISGGRVPVVDPTRALRCYRAVFDAIQAGLLRSCHDLSEGGLAVAAAEMAFAGGTGMDLDAAGKTSETDDMAILFGESATRWLIEVEPEKAHAIEALFAGLPLMAVGKTVQQSRLRIAGRAGDWIIWATLDELKAAWQSPLI